MTPGDRTTAASWVRSSIWPTSQRTDGKLAATGVVPFDRDRVHAHWYLWEGDRPGSIPTRRSLATSPSSTRTSSSSFPPTRRTSAGSGSPTRRCSRTSSIVLEPNSLTHRSRMWGVLSRPEPEPPRLHRQRRQGSWHAALRLGHSSSPRICPRKFATRSSRRSGRQHSLEDEEYRKRLQDKFGSRWLTTQLVQARRTTLTHGCDAEQRDGGCS